MEKVDRSLREELLLAIANAAHAEYHFTELVQSNADKQCPCHYREYMDTLRKIRIELMNKLAKEFPNVLPLWCTIKHLLLAYFHTLEVLERKPSGAVAKAGNNILELVHELLDINGAFDDFEACIRCNETKPKNG